MTEEQQSEKNEIVKVENGNTSETFSVDLANLKPATMFSIMIDIENNRIKSLLDSGATNNLMKLSVAEKL